MAQQLRALLVGFPAPTTGSSQLSITPALGDLTASSGLLGYLHTCAYTFIQIHINEIKNFCVCVYVCADAHLCEVCVHVRMEARE